MFELNNVEKKEKEKKEEETRRKNTFRGTVQVPLLKGHSSHIAPLIRVTEDKGRVSHSRCSHHSVLSEGPQKFGNRCGSPC